jgi:hypothetical protein
MEPVAVGGRPLRAAGRAGAACARPGRVSRDLIAQFARMLLIKNYKGPSRKESRRPGAGLRQPPATWT